jgi:hypothetical protein
LGKTRIYRRFEAKSLDVLSKLATITKRNFLHEKNQDLPDKPIQNNSKQMSGKSWFFSCIIGVSHRQ